MKNMTKEQLKRYNNQMDQERVKFNRDCRYAGKKVLEEVNASWLTVREIAQRVLCSEKFTRIHLNRFIKLGIVKRIRVHDGNLILAYRVFNKEDEK